MAKWSHGYNTDIPYTLGYYRETTPEWMDFALLISGFWPPEREPDRPLRYMDLGCGQGFGLCVTAALHPEMEFVGIDFNPTHIHHATTLAKEAGLTNVKFIEADFVELGAHWPEELGTFDYVVLHGIWSWIGPVVREGAVGILRQAVRPGGVVYNSYNAQPGWHAGAILKELLSLSVKAASGDAQLEALRKGVSLANRLREAGATVFRAYPGLMNRVEMLQKHDLRYIANEYAHEALYIYWGHEVADEMYEAKLTLAATATLPENFLPAFLPDSLAKIVNEYTHPRMRNLLIDLIINQAFRRDLYQRGIVRALKKPQLERLMATRVVGLRSGKKDFKFALSIGEVSGREELYGPLQEMCDEGPVTIQEIINRHPLKPTFAQVVQAVAILIWDGRAAFASTAESSQPAHSFNKAVVNAFNKGQIYQFLAAPATNQGISVPPIEMLCCGALMLNGAGAGKEEVTDLVVKNFEELGLSIQKDGVAITDPDARRAEIAKDVENFFNEKLAVYSHLGII